MLTQTEEKKMHMLASLWNKIKMAVYNCQTSCDIGWCVGREGGTFSPDDPHKTFYIQKKVKGAS